MKRADIKQSKLSVIPMAAVMFLIISLFVVPFVCPDQIYLFLIFNTIGIYIIVNSGLDIVYGYSGQISIGQAGFYAIGAYTSALLSMKLGLPVIVTLLLGGLIAALVGALIAIPSTKVVHHFLALVTIGFGEIVRLIFHNGGEFTGGPDGITAIPALMIGSMEITSFQSYYYVILICVIVFSVAKLSLVNSRIGRAFLAIRYNPESSLAFGINVPAYKVIAFSIGAFYAGLGGALYAHMIRFISPETFTLNQSVLFLTMILLGGACSFWGPVVGAILLTILFEYLQSFGTYQTAVYGIIIVLVVFFMPTGIIGGFRTLANKRSVKTQNIK
ncbi:MAG: branched-chain amino acid ABC transporter permease [Planctomycetota bacterium]|jgi:branched-chain amino acid transport system permease protein